MKNRWEIIDDSGTIHSGSEDEMKKAFQDIKEQEPFSDYSIDGWSGDLKLVEVHERLK